MVAPEVLLLFADVLNGFRRHLPTQNVDPQLQIDFLDHHSVRPTGVVSCWSSTSENQSSTDDPDEPPLPNDAEGVGWCHWGRCRPMPTAPERLCCQDMRQCTERNVECICEDEYFYNICLDTEVLRVAYCELQERGAEPVLDVHEKDRYTAYRQITPWMWGRLVPRNRKTIPACVFWMIRKMFPSSNYQCFKYPDL
ncbi:hypothetical protein MTO96_038416 [Rhipicephalus appendiculatus]